MFAYLSLKFNSITPYKGLSILFIVALIVRYAVFGLYIQYNERFHQADSMDYHNCALGMSLGIGMTRADTHYPIFWRTPGYPWYLAPFYSWYGIKSGAFSDNNGAQKASILVQIIFCSLLPIFVFFLAWSLTGITWISWLSAWISVFHVGFVLASTYLLTDGLAQLFFIIFMYFFYQSFVLLGEPNHTPPSVKNMLFNVSLAALALALYTWMRPHGKFTAGIALFLLLLGACSWRVRLTKTLLFGLIFFAAIFGWYLRNYNVTGQWFFCPMSGPYLQAFSAPKILRRITGKPLDKCLYSLLYQGEVEIQKETQKLAKNSPQLVLARELVCGRVAWPLIQKYPGYFMYDWFQEVVKTTFDLYSSQLVAFQKGTYTYDDIEEFLPTKLAECLYKQPMPWGMRLICWLEFIFSIATWIAFVGGFGLFVIYPLLKKFYVSPYIHRMFFLWLKTGILIGAMLMMTGGFGYARLRIPFEPLMIIVALTFWYWVFFIKKDSIILKSNS